MAFSWELRNGVESRLRCDLHHQITFNLATTGETCIIWGYTGCIENVRWNYKTELITSKQSNKVHVNVWPEMSGFWAQLQDYFSAVNTLTVLYFTYSGYNVYRTLSRLSNCWVLILFRVAIHKKCSKCPPESANSGARLIMDCRTVSKLLEAIANGLTGIENGSVKVLFFFSWSRIH